MRRQVGEKNIRCITPTVKHGGRNVMVLGCFGARKVDDLHLLFTFHPLLYNYTGCIYCTSYVILLPFNIYLCTSCTLHSLHYLLCLQFTAPVYSHSSLYIFLIFLRPLCCCVVLFCAVLCCIFCVSTMRAT